MGLCLPEALRSFLATPGARCSKPIGLGGSAAASGATAHGSRCRPIDRCAKWFGREIGEPHGHDHRAFVIEPD